MLIIEPLNLSVTEFFRLKSRMKRERYIVVLPTFRTRYNVANVVFDQRTPSHPCHPMKRGCATEFGRGFSLINNAPLLKPTVHQLNPRTTLHNYVVFPRRSDIRELIAPAGHNRWLMYVTRRDFPLTEWSLFSPTFVLMHEELAPLPNNLSFVISLFCHAFIIKTTGLFVKLWKINGLKRAKKRCDL